MNTEVQSQSSAPAVESHCSAPAVESHCSAPAVESHCSALAVESHGSAPAVESHGSVPAGGEAAGDQETPLVIPQPGTPEWKRSLPRPHWLRVRLHTEESFARVSGILKAGGLHTVCREARCPNCHECWTSGTATFIIMGDVCTRSCAYCAVKSGHPLPLDPREPAEVARAVQSMNLRHAVVTSVDRDDCSDFGAGHFAAVIRSIRELCPDTSIEVLIPDFAGSETALNTLLEAQPSVLNHNVETVPRLYKRLRSKGVYARCLELLQRADRWRSRPEASAAARQMRTKSGLMLGFGETRAEVLAVMDDLRAVNCDLLTLGQYLRPSLQHVPVMRFWTPEEFAELKDMALQRGFAFVEAGPLVRSSYHAQRALTVAE